MFEAERQGISVVERCRAGLGAAVSHSISYLGSLWFLKSTALGFQIFVCCVLCVHQRTLLQYCVSTGSSNLTLMFSPQVFFLTCFLRRTKSHSYLC